MNFLLPGNTHGGHIVAQRSNTYVISDSVATTPKQETSESRWSLSSNRILKKYRIVPGNPDLMGCGEQW